jgi:hypothetical protein
MAKPGWKLWLLLLIPLSIPVVASILGRKPPCANKVEVSIGVQPSGAPGWRASLQRLSDEIKRCPNANLYVIHRRTKWISTDSSTRLATRYDRAAQRLTDSRYGEGSGYWWSKVTDKPIHAIAAQGGTFDDLASYGCVDDSP